MITQVAPFKGRKTAAIDGRNFTSLTQGMEMLAQAEALARKEGYQTLVGPMQNGSWGAYRLVLYSDGSPSFNGEPQSAAYDLEAYLKSGFSIAEMHSSAKVTLLDKQKPQPHPRLDDFTINHWDGENAKHILTQVHHVTMAAFAKAPFFTPLPCEQFIAVYQPLLEKTDPRLLWHIDNKAGEMMAFLLSFPDPNWPETIIVKTYASLISGGGRALLDLIHWQGYQLGLTQAVHALMREGNLSTAASRRTGAKIFRRYALMEKRL